jgi:hypothetical protein
MPRVMGRPQTGNNGLFTVSTEVPTSEVEILREIARRTGTSVSRALGELVTLYARRRLSRIPRAEVPPEMPRARREPGAGTTSNGLRGPT